MDALIDWGNFLHGFEGGLEERTVKPQFNAALSRFNRGERFTGWSSAEKRWEFLRLRAYVLLAKMAGENT